MQELGAVLGRMGGIARTSELRAAGVSEGAIADAVTDGVLVRVRRGTYAAAETPALVRHALTHGGALCCASAAAHHGMWVLEPEAALHVWLGPNGRAHAADGCRPRVHRDEGRHPRGIVSPRVAVRQMLDCLGAEAFFCALESGLRHRILGAADVAWLREHVPRTHRRLVDLARKDADSGLESLIRLRLHLLGIEVRTQVRIGGVGVVDFVVGDRLILEADGSTHGGDHRHRDLVRDAVATGLGFVTLRYDYALIVHDWPLVEDAILSALGRGLHRSSGIPRRPF